MLVSEAMKKAVQAQLEESIKSDFLAEEVKKLVQESIKDSLRSIFSYGTDVREQIKDFFKDNLKFDCSKLNLEEHNEIILSEVKKALKGMVDNDLRSKAEAMVSEIVMCAPKEIKLSEIIEEYKNYISNKFEYSIEDKIEIDYDGQPHRWFEIEFEVNHDGSYSCSFPKITLGTGIPGVKEEVLITLYNKSKDIYEFCYGRTNTPGSFESKDLGSKIDMSTWHDCSEFEKLLYRLDKAKTPIIFDEDNVNCEISIEAECSC